MKKWIRIEEIGLKKVKLGSKTLGIGQIWCIIIEKFNGTLLQVLCLADFEENFFKLTLQMFGLGTNHFLLQKMRPWFIFWLHLAIHAVLLSSDLIFFILFIVLQFLVKDDIILKFVFVLFKKRVFHDVRESHAFLAVHHKDAFEKIFKLCCLFLQFIFFGQGVSKRKWWICTSSLDLSLHVMTCILLILPLNGYSANNIK